MPSPLTKKRIVVVDDHAMIRDGIRYQLSTESDLEVIGEAENGADAVALIKQANPDLVIVDISLADSHGLDLIKQLCAQKRDIKILVSTMYNESLYAERAIRAGAQGFLNKRDSRQHLLDAIRTVLSGKKYLSEEMKERLLNQAVGRIDPAHQTPVESLSDRELEVFQLIGGGETTGAIARQLHLSPHTIDTHREKIKIKLGLKRGTELQRAAIQWVLENG